MAQLAPNNHHHSEDMIDLLSFGTQQSHIWSMPKYYQIFQANGTWTIPIIHEVLIDFLQGNKITFGA